MVVTDILQAKCPKCGKGDIFDSKGNALLFKMPVMDKTCKECDYKFEVEPGFFFGAMFVSYALACAQMIASLVITWGILEIPVLYMFLCVVLMAFFTSALNFRLSRSIWIYMFYKDRKGK